VGREECLTSKFRGGRSKCLSIFKKIYGAELFFFPTKRVISLGVSAPLSFSFVKKEKSLLSKRKKADLPPRDLVRRERTSYFPILWGRPLHGSLLPLFPRERRVRSCFRDEGKKER